MSLRFERDGAVATLTLDRPQVGNAIDVPLARALMEAAIECDEDDAIRSVLLTGAGRLFCSGGDVGEFASAADSVASLLKELTAYLHMAIARFARMGKPLVTAINGPAAGVQSFHSSFETQMEAEARAIAESGKSRAGQEGIRAFLEKRTPEFGNQ
jgi:enoyl-CoA hydratase/carnithine racemase